jgi:hypothetical protein
MLARFVFDVGNLRVRPKVQAVHVKREQPEVIMVNPVAFRRQGPV